MPSLYFSLGFEMILVIIFVGLSAMVMPRGLTNLTVISDIFLRSESIMFLLEFALLFIAFFIPCTVFVM